MQYIGCFKYSKGFEAFFVDQMENPQFYSFKPLISEEEKLSLRVPQFEDVPFLVLDLSKKSSPFLDSQE